MKKKYLKKMLAIMLASMTVAATPGFVGAMSDTSKEVIKNANSKITLIGITSNVSCRILFEKVSGAAVTYRYFKESKFNSN